MSTTMMVYELTLSSEDIGEMLTIIRVQVLKIHAGPFSQKLGIKEGVLLDAEDGKGPHGIKILKKITELYPRIEVDLKIKIKGGV
jgi:hypothetical protein